MSKMVPVSAEEFKNCLGDSIYEKVVKRFGGRYLYINKKQSRFENPYFKLQPKERNTLMMQDYKSGMKAKELSVKYGLELRYTHNLIKKLKEREGNANGQ